MSADRYTTLVDFQMTWQAREEEINEGKAKVVKATDTRYDGYAQPDGQLVTRNDVRFDPIDWGITFGKIQPPFSWGRKGIRSWRLAFNLLLDVTLDRGLSYLLAKPLTSELVEEMREDGNWTVWGSQIRIWIAVKLNQMPIPRHTGAPGDCPGCGEG